MLLLKILCWLFLAIDAAVVGLFFLLGLAAAGPSHTNPLSVIFLMLLVPGVILAGLAFWSIRAQSIASLSGAAALAALPTIVVLVGLGITGVGALLLPKEARAPMASRPAPLNEIQNAVLAGDLAAVRKSAAVLHGHPDAAGVLILAVHRLEKSPENIEVLRALLAAGADPNSGYSQSPLELAILSSPKTGPAAVGLLLDAGAKPEARNPLGVPAVFAAVSPTVDTQVLQLLLDRGASVNAKSHRGETLLNQAATARNWKAALLLLNRGADAQLGRTENNQSFRDLAELAARSQPSNAELQQILQKLP